MVCDSNDKKNDRLRLVLCNFDPVGKSFGLDCIHLIEMIERFFRGDF